MIRITLIRHGRTFGNTMGRYIGVTDEPLLEEETFRLSKENLPTIDHLFSSPMTRCLQTAKILYPYAQPVIVENLKECNFGSFENKNYRELAANEDYQAWVDSGGRLKFPGGESPDEFKARCRQAFSEVVDTCIRRHYHNAALVVHGGTIMSIMEAYGVPARAYYDWHVDNGCGLRVYFPEELWKRGKKELHVEAELCCYKNDSEI